MELSEKYIEAWLIDNDIAVNPKHMLAFIKAANEGDWSHADWHGLRNDNIFDICTALHIALEAVSNSQFLDKATVIEIEKEDCIEFSTTPELMAQGYLVFDDESIIAYELENKEIFKINDDAYIADDIYDFVANQMYTWNALSPEMQQLLIASIPDLASPLHMDKVSALDGLVLSEQPDRENVLNFLADMLQFEIYTRDDVIAECRASFESEYPELGLGSADTILVDAYTKWDEEALVERACCMDWNIRLGDDSFMTNNPDTAVTTNVRIFRVTLICHQGAEADVLAILEENPEALESMLDYLRENPRLSDDLKSKLSFAADLPTTSAKVDYIRQLANKVPDIEAAELPDNLVLG